MKILLSTMLALALLCLSFTKEKTFTPPGTVQINDSLFADAFELSNSAWQEYEAWTAVIYGKDSKEHIATLPDTLCWREKLSFNEPYVLYYYRHPAYKNHPVVGISYEQAVSYCKWRTDRVKTSLSVKKDFKHQNIEYRLPTKAEWEKLAETSGNLLQNNGKNDKGIPVLNCRNLTEAEPKSNIYPDVTATVKSYEPNALKIYNALGNVAEMISEKGICKGGGWKNVIEECRIGKDMPYAKPNAWLGFRCVCVIKNNKAS